MKLSILLIIIFCFCLISPCQEKSYNRDDSTYVYNFIFQYGIGIKNVINTYDHTLTRGSICDSVVSIPFQLTSQELDTIRLGMDRIHILDYPKIFSPPWSDNTNGMERVFSSSFSYYLKFQIGDQIKEITWSDFNLSEIKMAKDLRGLFSIIRSIVESKEEYRMFPNPCGNLRGAYH